MIRCSALCALALVLTAQVALAQKVPKARVVVVDFDDDRRDAVRGQLENALEKNKQVELVPLKQYVSAANKARLRGAASRSPEGVAQIAPELGLSVVVTGKAGRTLVLRVLDANGQEVWTKSVKLQRGKLPAGEARKLAANIATAATQPPPSAQPATPEPPPTAPPPTPTAPTPTTPPDSGKPPPPKESPPPASKPPASKPPTATAPPKAPTESLELPKLIDDESHTTTEPVDEYATREELEAKDRHRHPPLIYLWVGGSTTWRTYCARPGVSSCAQFDSQPEDERVGDTIDFKSGVPYLGLMAQIEVLPLAH